MEKTSVLDTVDMKGFARSRKKGGRLYFVEIRGRHVGRAHRIDQEVVHIGRDTECGIVIDDEGVSRKHARVEHRTEETRIFDNFSTNGLFVNGGRVESHCLADGDRVQVGSNTILKFSVQDDVEENYQRKLYDQATRDGLTGAFNKKYFAEQLKSEFAYAFRHGIQLSLLLFDLDHFKNLNDTFGHLAGDFVLKELSRLVQNTLRGEDVFARYGGEEFGVILRETDLEKSVLAAERVCAAVSNHSFIFEEEALPVTISVGAATLNSGNIASPKDMVALADRYLYEAKRAGRNRVRSAQDSLVSSRID